MSRAARGATNQTRASEAPPVVGYLTPSGRRWWGSSCVAPTPAGCPPPRIKGRLSWDCFRDGNLLSTGQRKPGFLPQICPDRLPGFAKLCGQVTWVCKKLGHLLSIYPLAPSFRKKGGAEMGRIPAQPEVGQIPLPPDLSPAGCRLLARGAPRSALDRVAAASRRLRPSPPPVPPPPAASASATSATGVRDVRNRLQAPLHFIPLRLHPPTSTSCCWPEASMQRGRPIVGRAQDQA